MEPSAVGFRAAHTLRLESSVALRTSLVRLSQIDKLVGCLGIAPSSRRLRAGTSLSKFATQLRREGGVEPPQPDL